MNARWQQAMVLFLVMLTAVWLGWWLPRSAVVALLGVALVLALMVAFMAVEFGLMHAVNRTDPAPRARVTEVVRAWWAELWVAIRVFCWMQPFRHRAVPDWLPPRETGAPPSPQRGVVLLHGFMCNRGLWNDWIPLLTQRGHACVAVNLEPVRGSIHAYEEAVEAAVEAVWRATGRAPVLVGHSMGGLAARAWLHARPGAPDRVHSVITLGTPHRGTWLGQFSGAVNGRQMRLDGPWVQALQAGEPPGLARKFTCWYSNCDNIVFPASAATLPGADNRLIAGVAHVEMVFHPVVLQACLQQIRAEEGRA